MLNQETQNHTLIHLFIFEYTYIDNNFAHDIYINPLRSCIIMIILRFLKGDLKVRENGLLLSTGLTSRIIASSGDKVAYANGDRSSVDFHDSPDGAAVFSIDSGENSGG